MAGLETIISQIRSESEQSAAKVLADAREKADEILAQARAQAETECASVRRRSEQSVQNILERGKSAAELKRRQELLAEKQLLIGETIQMAREKLESMDLDAYFGMLARLAVKAAQPGEGELVLSAKDAVRMPDSFPKQLEEALSKTGASLHVSAQTRDMDGGFVLVYGGIEENCSIDALFDEVRERVQDQVQELLFS